MWKRAAILRRAKDEGILASDRRTNWLGAHEFDVREYGILKSKRHGTGLKVSYDSLREKGRIVILPADLPLAVKFFILAAPG